ncbi:hypothetical protein Tco_0152643 [Tanacetum coccineum]
MLAIFHDMIEESVKEFMDDFLVFENSFDTCLNNLDKMLQRFKMPILSLIGKNVTSWSKKELCSDTSFYQCFIKDFSKITRPLNKLLEKDTPFEFYDECQKAFKLLKEKLTCASVIILLLQEFDIEIKDRKGTKNVAADHLSRIENDYSSDDSEVDDNFPRETLMEINIKDEPWFADFEEPYLFKVCFDGMIKRCISGPETGTILDQCHHRPTGGHYGPNITAKRSWIQVSTGQQSSKKLIL